jgi:type IV pilus assembly protein PilC
LSSYKNISELSNNLSILIKSGIPMNQSLQIISDETNNKKLKIMVQKIISNIESGKSFADSLEEMKNIPFLFKSFAKVGEATGSLDVVLDKLAAYYENKKNLKWKIITKLIYPTIIIIGIIIVSVTFMSFLEPLYENINSEFNSKMPLITKVFLGSIQFLSSNVFNILVLSILSIVFFKILMNINKLKYYYHKSLFRLPIIKKIMYAVTLDDLFYIMYILISGGINILEAIAICKDCNSNLAVKNVIRRIESNITNGTSLSESIKQEKLPAKIHNLITIGEQSGTLEENINKLQIIYMKEAEVTFKIFEKMIEPTITIILGGFVGIMAAAVIQPAYSMLSSIK